MTDLEKFQAVNACKTVSELSETILSLCDANGDIKGRKRMFDGKKMAGYVDFVVRGGAANVLTREFGIRQQALYLRSVKAE